MYNNVNSNENDLEEGPTTFLVIMVIDVRISDTARERKKISMLIGRVVAMV